MENIIEKKHGIILTILLGIILISNIFTAFAYFSKPEAITAHIPIATNEIIYGLGILTVLNVLFVVLIWIWKKWGVYGMCINAAIALSLIHI